MKALCAFMLERFFLFKLQIRFQIRKILSRTSVQIYKTYMIIVSLYIYVFITYRYIDNTSFLTIGLRYMFLQNLKKNEFLNSIL